MNLYLVKFNHLSLCLIRFFTSSFFYLSECWQWWDQLTFTIKKGDIWALASAYCMSAIGFCTIWCKIILDIFSIFWFGLKYNFFFCQVEIKWWHWFTKLSEDLLFILDNWSAFSHICLCEHFCSAGKSASVCIHFLFCSSGNISRYWDTISLQPFDQSLSLTENNS